MNTRHLLISCWLTLCTSLPGTAVPPTNVTGTQGHSVSLHPGIPVGPDIPEVEWSRVWPRNRIVKYSNGNINYYGNGLYKNRITFHPGNVSLEIRDLRREDSGEYDVIYTATSSGDEYKTKVRLEVYEPVSGANITVQNITRTCNLTLTCSVTSGNPTSFSWWRRGDVTGDNSSHHFWRHGETIQIHCTAEIGDVVYRCEASNPISEDTAQVRLENVCNLDICTPKTTAVSDAVTLVIGLSVAGTLLISALTAIFTVTWRRRPEGTEVTSETESKWM
ncbi:SLAM family member 8-like [Hypanus sabinus]|uniref:SLAM family member 8-like n=1 Tax=Hypanus sabinus TaxID=79690 RepID=UPI0028C3CE08|nr:SLAM family member 8-like [Hypanus sabinus]